MQIGDILARKGRDVDIVRPDSYVSTVVSLLKLKGIGELVVSDDGKTVSGIISERDVVRGLAEHGAAVMELSVADLMTSNVRTCRANMKAAVAGVWLTNPFTFIPLYYGCYLFGLLFVPRQPLDWERFSGVLSDASQESEAAYGSLQLAADILIPLWTGGALLGLHA